MAITLMTSLNTIQQCLNRPHAVASDWMTPVKSEATANGTMNQVQTLTRRWAWGRSYNSSAERTAALTTWLNHYG